MEAAFIEVLLQQLKKDLKKEILSELRSDTLDTSSTKTKRAPLPPSLSVEFSWQCLELQVDGLKAPTHSIRKYGSSSASAHTRTQKASQPLALGPAQGQKPQELTPAQLLAIEFFKRAGQSLPENFTLNELKHAFRVLALQFHPDRQGGNSERFQLLTECYQQLTESFCT